MTTYEAMTERSSTDDRGLALVGHILMLTGWLTSGVTSVIAVVLAYVRRGEADATTRWHYDFQIKTFWVGFIGTAVGFALLLGMIVPLLVGGASPNADFSDMGREGGLAVSAGVLMVLGIVVLVCVWVATLIMSIVGLIKLASNQPTGRGPTSY